MSAFASVLNGRTISQPRVASKPNAESEMRQTNYSNFFTERSNTIPVLTSRPVTDLKTSSPTRGINYKNQMLDHMTNLMKRQAR